MHAIKSTFAFLCLAIVAGQVHVDHDGPLVETRQPEGRARYPAVAEEDLRAAVIDELGGREGKPLTSLFG